MTSPIIFYKERFGKPEIEAFAVVKTRMLVVSRNEKDAKFSCVIEDFFPLMGVLIFNPRKMERLPGT